MKDGDFAVDYFTEGWPKDSKDKISFLYSDSLIPSTKNYYFFRWKKYEYRKFIKWMFGSIEIDVSTSIYGFYT